MGIENEISIIDRRTIELHNWFTDNTHLMDAVVQNKCEYEFLGIIREIASVFKIVIIIETEPLADGGLRRWFKVAAKDENKKATITVALIVAFLTSIIVTPITTSISKATEKLIEKFFEDPEINKLEKEKLKLEIEKLRQEISKNSQQLEENSVIKKKKSNFYEVLEKYPKVEKVSFLVSDSNKKERYNEQVVYRRSFKEFILVSDELEPTEIDNAVIEIISPVLKKGNYKWMGIYNGEPIPFSMKSKEFKTLVQVGEIKFKNGTAINCHLVVHKKIDNEGVERITSFEVTRVNNYFENDKPIETPEGRRHRQKKEGEKQQLNLFTKDNDKEK
ncbi:hypothetical protein [Adhaeribacter pallidiroseus]|uniref:Uncharacterized protein n=1 Tax=Adhaeribacter pallidiroseus TaxID=2072847 RepID=A0A369QU08_9BACT|nr:hypothetical protein [Adhaeribacter pallidiroseus]RDC65648.1 hypothetical protein AHMF7616_04278 [Adhaeribacter pallidiroseus]